MVDRIPWFGPVVGEAEAEALMAVVASGYLNDGSVARELEQEIARFLGVRHAVTVTSGTTAISLALLAAGIGPGDEVIVPDLTFIATANAVTMIGATVKLVDVDPERFTIDVAAAEAAIGPLTRAIVPVDVNGRGADYAAIGALCDAYKLVLVCDAAEALGSRSQGRYLGTFGQAGCFSFSANKTVTSGQGGIVATNDDDMHNRLRELKDQGRRLGGTGGDDLHPMLGFNFKYTNLQAAVALEQFRKLPNRLGAMKERDQLYRERLSNVPDLVLPETHSNEIEVCQWFDILTDRRAELMDALAAEHIGARAFWLPLHRQKCYGQGDAAFPNSIDISNRGLWLASHPAISSSHIEDVCHVVRGVLLPSTVVRNEATTGFRSPPQLR